MIDWLRKFILQTKVTKSDAEHLLSKYGTRAYDVAMDRAEGRDSPGYRSHAHWQRVALVIRQRTKKVQAPRVTA